MSSSSIIDDDLTEKDIPVQRNQPSTRLAPVRTQSSLDIALDAEANFKEDDSSPPADGTATNNTAAHDDPGPPPNGGFRAWLQVAGSFFLFFNCW